MQDRKKRFKQYNLKHFEFRRYLCSVALAEGKGLLYGIFQVNVKLINFYSKKVDDEQHFLSYQCLASAENG